MTIDINELRRLAQVATPGPWHFWSGWVAAEIDKDGGIVIVERPTPSGGKYQARVDANFKFIATANPQAILELLDRLEAAESDGLEQARLLGMSGEREAELLAKLEVVEKERDSLRTELNEIRYGVAVAHDTIKALRAKIEAMEKQEPVAWMDRHGTLYNSVSHVRPSDKPLYTLPGAQNVPEKLCYDSRWEISIDYVDGWSTAS